MASESKCRELRTLNNANIKSRHLVLDRIQSEWLLKLALVFALTAWVYLPYYYLQRHHFFPSITMPASALDRLIPFWSDGIWFYLSIYLLMPIGPLFMANRQQLLRYGIGIMLIGVIADVIFLLWPTICPRPEATGSNGAYRALIAIDTPFHACPSLHASFAVFSALCGMQVFREITAARRWCGVLWLWALLILAGTLLTKQHVVTDIIAGSVLGLGGYFLAFHKWRSGQKMKQLYPTANPKTNQTNSTAI